MLLAPGNGPDLPSHASPDDGRPMDMEGAKLFSLQDRGVVALCPFTEVITIDEVKLAILASAQKQPQLFTLLAGSLKENRPPDKITVVVVEGKDIECSATIAAFQFQW